MKSETAKPPVVSRELEILADAAEYLFRGRLDKLQYTGPVSQLALFVPSSYHAFIIDRQGDTLTLEAYHRRHAKIENAIRDLKYGVGLNHLPRAARRECCLARVPGPRAQPRSLEQSPRPR